MKQLEELIRCDRILIENICGEESAATKYWKNIILNCKKLEETKKCFIIFVFLISFFGLLENKKSDFSNICKNELVKPSHS